MKNARGWQVGVGQGCHYADESQVRTGAGGSRRAVRLLLSDALRELLLDGADAGQLLLHGGTDAGSGLLHEPCDREHLE